MIIAIGNIVSIYLSYENRDVLCVVLSEATPEFIGMASRHYYYEVYCFETASKFIAFDYEMVPLGPEGLRPYFVEG